MTNDRRRKPRREADLAHISVDDMALIEKDQSSRGAKEEQDTSVPETSSPDHRILLVEDNVDLRAYIGKMLSRFGHRVMTAVDGLDGWEHVQTDLPDLVVTDIMMPRMDGYELINRIKTRTKRGRSP